MPKRIVDGEGLWHSNKLRRVAPAWMRAEYANLLPLAEANGSFECNSQLVWSTVYAYNRPDITPKKAEAILAELERVRLLFRWEEGGKQWGYWTGIERPGRLPPPSRKNHYPLGATPPFERIQAFLKTAENTNVSASIDQAVTIGYPKANQQAANGCIGIGIGIGTGTGSTSYEVLAQSDELKQTWHVELPLNDQSKLVIYESQTAEWKKLFPAVNVLQQLNHMRAWCLANPTRCKTRRGIHRFIINWLSKEQDRSNHDNSNGRARKPNILDVIRESKRMPDFGSGDVSTEQPMAPRADKRSGQA